MILINHGRVVLLLNKNMDVNLKKYVVLIGDIGGTNSRLSLVRMTDVILI